jgi:hypothetical protein
MSDQLVEKVLAFAPAGIEPPLDGEDNATRSDIISDSQFMRDVEQLRALRSI